MSEQIITWAGAEALEAYLVPIESLKETENNPDKGEAHVAELMGSLRRFGQVRPILVDADDGVTIRAGHHLRRAAREEGWSHIAAIPSKFDSLTEALAYVVADNQLAEMGQRDAGQQLALIDAVDPTNLEGTGWTMDDYENLRALLEAVPEIPQVEPWTGGHAETPEEAAARAAAIAAQVQHKEVVLMLNLEEHKAFQDQIAALARDWGTSGAKETFLRCVAQAYSERFGVYVPDPIVVEDSAPPEPQVGEATDEPRTGIELPADGTPVELPADDIDPAGEVVQLPLTGEEEPPLGSA